MPCIVAKVTYLLDIFPIYLYTLAVSPFLVGSRQHKETTKAVGVLLRSSSNDEGPGRVWIFPNVYKIDYVFSYFPGDAKVYMKDSLL